MSRIGRLDRAARPVIRGPDLKRADWGAPWVRRHHAAI